MYLYPAFYGDGAGNSFKHYSFHDLSSGRVPAKLFKNKIVLIGATATGIGEIHVTPVDNQMSGVEYHAHVIQSILDEEFFTRPPDAFMIELLLLVGVGLYLSILLLRLSAMAGAIISLLLLVTLLGTGFMLLLTSAIWIQTVTAALLLLFGHLLLTTKHHFASEDAREKISADSAETNKMLGLSFQQQGMLDLALEKFRKIPMEEEGAKDLLYNLGLDFERKRQFSKALATYNLVIEDGQNFKDLEERVPKLKGAEATMIFGASGEPRCPQRTDPTIR